MNARILPRLAAIGLGSSLGDRRATLELALLRLDHTPGLSLVRGSRWYRTPPLRGGTATGWFLNGVAVFRTDLPARSLLERCRELEDLAGRRRSRFWGDRTLDLDVLLIEGEHLNELDLKVPHPALPDRPFALLPLLEIWPDAVEPSSGVAYATMPSPTGPMPVPDGVVARPPRPVTALGPSAPGAP